MSDHGLETWMQFVLKCQVFQCGNSFMFLCLKDKRRLCEGTFQMHWSKHEVGRFSLPHATVTSSLTTIYRLNASGSLS